MTVSYSGFDKRKHKRFRIQLVVTYRREAVLDVVIRHGDKNEKGLLLDISEGGISLLSHMDISVGSILYVQFSFAQVKDFGLDLTGDIKLRGQVRYCTVEKDNMYKLGVCFVDVKDKARKDIESFLFFAQGGKNG
ncbi:MAG: PilZ domain-containing protein [Candidatus Omnitrophica bacterium]|jgi:c-di-GMP-binding flagellar brake protein YcgR|nr:PilZ domain-containing protein [Candidatus Omnitrophota bacterium]